MLDLLNAPGIRDILYGRSTDIRGADPACRGAMSFSVSESGVLQASPVDDR